MAEFIEVFPARANVGKDIITPERFPAKFAEKMVKTGLWTYTPKPKTEDDFALMLDKAKEEIGKDANANKAEREAIAKERAELEALKAQLQTTEVKTKGKKTEV